MGDTDYQQIPAQIPSLKGVSALVAGGSHSLAFLQEGGLLVFGFNVCGQLGLGHTDNPIAFPTLSSVQPALPRAGAVQKAFEWELVKKSIWDTAKELFESQSGWNEAEPLSAMTEKELKDHREEFQTGLESGRTPVADWGRLHISAKHHLVALQQDRNAQSTLLAQKEAKRARLDQELEQARSEVTRLEVELADTSDIIQTSQAAQEATEKQMNIVASFEPLLRTAAEAASGVYNEMKSKLSPFRPDVLTCSDLGFSLSLFGVSNALKIAETLEKDNSMAKLGGVTASDLEEFGVLDVMERQRILLALHILTNELILDNEHVEACGMCKNQTPEETVAYLEENGITFLKQRVLELGALVGHLMLMDAITLQSTLNLELSDAIAFQERLKVLTEQHLHQYRLQ